MQSHGSEHEGRLDPADLTTYDGPWTFGLFHSMTRWGWSGAYRQYLFGELPERCQAECWAQLAAQLPQVEVAA